MRSNAFKDTIFCCNRSSLVCKNICERIRYKRLSFGAGGNYFDGKKYCRRCEVYMYNDGMFCTYCGMPLRLKPSYRKYKEILRTRKIIPGVHLVLVDWSSNPVILFLVGHILKIVPNKMVKNLLSLILLSLMKFVNNPC